MKGDYKNESAVVFELGDERNLWELLDSPESRTNFLHIRHPEQSQVDENLTQISRRFSPARQLLLGLTARGFYTYSSRNFETRMVLERRIPTLWQPLVSGEFLQSSLGVIYSLTQAVVESETPKLLVLLCPMHASMYSSSLYRYFPQNFKSIQKYIAPDTAVLRIADLGGVVGSFYVDTTTHPENVDRIQALVGLSIRDLNVKAENVVFYGGSKGGTGALLHGLVGRYKVVAVDPVLSDRHYEERHRDSHFTRDSVFMESKDDLFVRTVAKYRSTADWDSPDQRKVIIYSSLSPQATYINSIALEPLAEGVSSFDVVHPSIKDHPDVGPNSLPLTTTVINNLLYGLDPPLGNRQVI